MSTQNFGVYSAVILVYDQLMTFIKSFQISDNLIVNTFSTYSTESYILITAKNNPFKFYTIEVASEATYYQTISIGKSTSAYCTLFCDDPRWFFSFENLSDNGMICSDVATTPSLVCFELAGYNIPITYAQISGSNAFAATTSKTTTDLVLLSVNFGSTLTWSKKLVCSSSPGCSFANGMTYVDSSQNTIY